MSLDLGYRVLAMGEVGDTIGRGAGRVAGGYVEGCVVGEGTWVEGVDTRKR